MLWVAKENAIGMVHLKKQGMNSQVLGQQLWQR